MKFFKLIFNIYIHKRTPRQEVEQLNFVKWINYGFKIDLIQLILHSKLCQNLKGRRDLLKVWIPRNVSEKGWKKKGR